MNAIGRYELRQVIGSGSMGQVYLGWDPVIQRQVAIKTLHKDLADDGDLEELATRFKREAVAAGRLTHPNIVTVHEYGESGDTAWIAMEHAAGRNLREYLADHPVPPSSMVLAVARQLFAALTYAHEQGIWHRDLKPSNVVLVDTPGDAEGFRAKVLDFGIARISTSASVTQVGTVVGTPGYMSPEQYRGDPVDARTDIYALGVTLFEMVTGQRPFRGSLTEVLEQVMAHPAPLASSLRAGVPATVDAVLARALARDPDDRYPDMRAFREAFVAALTEEGLAEGTVEREVHLPPPLANDPTTTALPAAFPRASTGPRPKLLFVDDEERILGALSALFRLRYEVLVCTDGQRALDLVREHRPLVIVSDQRMPGMTGIEFLRQAREIDPASVRLLLTGYSDLAAIVGSINDGEVFRFVNKPWSNQDLKQTVAEAVAVAQATRQAAALPDIIIDASETERAAEAILVAQPGRALFDEINARFGRTRPVCHAEDVTSVLQAVEDQEVAVLLCDLDRFRGGPELLKLLKQLHPRVQAIALSTEADSSELVRLINQAQLFRFLLAPVRPGFLDRSIRSALGVHANQKARPVLAQRQQVQPAPEAARSSLGQQILQRLSLFVRVRRPLVAAAKVA